MNPLIRKYLSQLDSAVDDLHEALAASRDALEREQAAKEEIRKQFWAGRKEIAVLKQANESFAALQEENAALQARHAAVREHLNRILGYAKALTGEFRP